MEAAFHELANNWRAASVRDDTGAGPVGTQRDSSPPIDATAFGGAAARAKNAAIRSREPPGATACRERVDKRPTRAIRLAVETTDVDSRWGTADRMR